MFNVHLRTVHYHHFNGSEQDGCQTTEQMHFNSPATSLFLIIILISNRLPGANCVSPLLDIHITGNPSLHKPRLINADYRGGKNVGISGWEK